jgi:hypothetical protein
MPMQIAIIAMWLVTRYGNNSARRRRRRVQFSTSSLDVAIALVDRLHLVGHAIGHTLMRRPRGRVLHWRLWRLRSASSCFCTVVLRRRLRAPSPLVHRSICASSLASGISPTLLSIMPVVLVFFPEQTHTAAGGLLRLLRVSRALRILRAFRFVSARQTGVVSVQQEIIHHHLHARQS